mgnify:FL=1
MSDAGSSNDSIYPVKQAGDRNYLVDKDKYQKMYRQSVDDNEGFWAEQAQSLDWSKPF